MSDTVIKVENLAKQYRLGLVGTGTISHDLNRLWHRLRGKEDPYLQLGEINDRTAKGSSDVVWALKEINFDVKRGEVLGIIGRNGAGKSTLLKILSRVTAPTLGDVKVKGRIASLLEVGTGFHPELTGRENIFLNGAILGMTKREIRSKFDEIVDFSGVERYIDTPVKRYSSGMYVRLAFAVAAHLEPEILIVDEVLAVGDGEFQKKCLGKMKAVSGEGRTVLFVSHNMQAISTLTEKCLLLKNGTIEAYGDSPSVMSNYFFHDQSASHVYAASPENKADAYINSVEVLTSEPGGMHGFGKPLKIQFEIICKQPVKNAALSFQVRNNKDMPVLHLWTFDSHTPMLRTAGKYKVTCVIPKSRLYLGKYLLDVHFSSEFGAKKLQTLSSICQFEVEMLGLNREYKWVPDTCTFIEDSNWEIIHA